MARIAKAYTFSLMPEQAAEMEEILKATGLTRSQLIQALLVQCKKNDLLVNLCVKELINQAGERWAASHNVGYDPAKRKPGQFKARQSDVSSNTYQNPTKEEAEEQARLIEIAKFNWIENYE